jgi:monolysocardiolipin acyltransferase
MLAAGPNSLKAAFLKTYKESGRRVATDVNSNSTADKYLLQYGFQSTDPTRALSELHTLFVEGDLRQLWQKTKDRLGSQFRGACGAYQPRSQTQASRQSSRVAAAELQPLYGTDGFLRTAVMYLLAHGSRSFMTVMNSTQVEGAERMAAALGREQGRPLITVCNHVASMDDPLVMSTIVPAAAFTDPQQLRWTLCASDRCFHRDLLVPFFRAAKVLPVERGAGMFQPGLAAAEERLRAGDWVHIFPEGTRSRDGKMGPVRKGVGRLVAACSEADPLIVPFVHSGMEGVLPKGSLLPKTNREIKVLVGEPIDVSDLLAASQAHDWSDDQLYSRIAKRIGGRMAALKAQLDGQMLDVDAQYQLQQQVLEQDLDLYDPVDNLHRAQSLLERVNFKMQHREWVDKGLAAAKGAKAAAAERLSAAAASLSRVASGDNLTGSAQNEAGAADKQRPLALVSGWLSRDALCGRDSEYYSYQRSVAMMQLLQARV